MTPRILAVDLGGTKIRSAVISQDGQVLDRVSRDTGAAGGPEAVVPRILSAIDELLSRAVPPPDRIGISAAGAIDMKRGVVTHSPNLPGWTDIPLRDVVKEKYGLPTFLLHDASAAALGEHRFGAGRGTSDLVYLTVSTGIGGGIIIDGRLYCGVDGSAGEIGHMTIDVNGPPCTCGNIGCLEVLASGTAIAREAARRVLCGEESSLSRTGNVEEITARMVSQAAEDGDRLAASVIRQAATYLGVGLVNIVNMLNPEIVVIGGGVAQMGERLLGRARQVVQDRAFRLPARSVRIVRADLGDDGGLIGAALFALQQS